MPTDCWLGRYGRRLSFLPSKSLYIITMIICTHRLDAKLCPKIYRAWLRHVTDITHYAMCDIHTLVIQSYSKGSVRTTAQAELNDTHTSCSHAHLCRPIVVDRFDVAGINLCSLGQLACCTSEYEASAWLRGVRWPPLQHALSH